MNKEEWIEWINNESGSDYEANIADKVLAELAAERERVVAMILDRASTAFGNMEGCDRDEFVRWEARYVGMCELYEAVTGKKLDGDAIRRLRRAGEGDGQHKCNLGDHGGGGHFDPLG